MKKFLALVLVPVLSGCLTSATPPSVSKWNIGYDSVSMAPVSPKYGVVRLSQVIVRAPYNDISMAVLRANGSMAFDPYNEYAAHPAQLFKGLAFDGIAASGVFSAVVGASSSAFAPYTAEVVVTKLALDCRTSGERRAIASVFVRILKDREIVAGVNGEGSCDAADGNYGAAFSKAVSAAFVTALKQL